MRCLEGPKRDGEAVGAAVRGMTPGQAALVGLLDRYLRGLLDPFVTLQEAHKLLYLMQAAGEPLKVRFRKGHYGPYGENLAHLMGAMEGHMISGHGAGSDRPGKRLELVPRALEDAEEFLANKTETQAHFDRVSELVAGFESPFGLELLSTVHWVVVEEDARSVEEAAEKTYAWSKRKKQFSPRQIALAYDVLSTQGWFRDAARTPTALAGSSPAAP